MKKLTQLSKISKGEEILLKMKQKNALAYKARAISKRGDEVISPLRTFAMKALQK